MVNLTIVEGTFNGVNVAKRLIRGGLGFKCSESYTKTRDVMDTEDFTERLPLIDILIRIREKKITDHKWC